MPGDREATSPGSGPQDRRTGRTKKPPRRVSETYLKNAALRYLERYASSEKALRIVLMRRVRASAAFHGTDPEEGAALVEDIIRRYGEAGLLNDRSFAETRARSLLRRGAPARMIRHRLREKGVSGADIDAALNALREEDGPEDPDLAAAWRYARRRRIGPFRSAETRAAARDRDLAALARRGFSRDIAVHVIHAEIGAEIGAEVGADIADEPGGGRAD